MKMTYTHVVKFRSAHDFKFSSEARAQGVQLYATAQCATLTILCEI